MARAVARIDVAAVERNCAHLDATVGEGVELCAVVKADGYGHGADACASAALAGGATRLAVATGIEAAEIGRRFPHVPLLTMGALTEAELDAALAAGSEVAVWHEDFRGLAATRARAQGRPVRVHVKHDSGMGRLGNRDPQAVLALCRACEEDPNLELAGVWTHFATADEPDSGFFDEQLGRFTDLAAAVKAESPGVIAHAANSAAVFREPRAHFDMVRCGIAVYGLDPFQGDPAERGLAPALSLRSYVADVKRLGPGDSVGYGQTWKAAGETRIGVLPIGYGDGVRRGLSNNAEVLVRGRRHPLIGTVSMDNVTIELGPETEVEPGDEAVLIGAQGEETILTEEVAARLGTINYEVTCGISARVPREAGCGAGAGSEPRRPTLRRAGGRARPRGAGRRRDRRLDRRRRRPRRRPRG
jgi:alanine racemase